MEGEIITYEDWYKLRMDTEEFRVLEKGQKLERSSINQSATKWVKRGKNSEERHPDFHC